MKIPTVIFAVTLLATSARAEDPKAAFDAGNYADAAKQLEPQLAMGPPTAEGYANLALANQKAGNPTAAALNYERALLLDPGLKSAQNARAEMAPAQHVSLPPHTWMNDVTAVVHPDALVGVGATLFWLGAFGLVFATQATRRRGVFNAVAVVALIFGGVAVAAGWLCDPRLAEGKPALVTAKDGVDVLTAPTNNSSKVLSLTPGSPVQVISPSGAWAYVRLGDGAKGWVQTDRLTPLVPGETL